MANRESDQPIVLGGWESQLHGEGVDRDTLVQRKHLPDMQGWIDYANLTATITKKAMNLSSWQITDGSFSEEPGAVIPHTGICARCAG